MKLIAFYLPQFHRIPENDTWWGEGFTEWTNVKSAKPLFKGHIQPRVPYNDNYYNLTNGEVREWQAKLAQKYGIYGFCYYHYWFKGVQLLERPFNEVLALKKPNFPFCLSWANEPWTSTWDGKEKEILMPQNYGGINEWKKHFDYLLKAFKDKRYIRIDNKPIFLIYRPDSIINLNKMLAYWNALAKQKNLDGIFFIETLSHFSKKRDFNCFQASLEFEPMYTLRHDLSFSTFFKKNFTSFLRKLTNKTIFAEKYFLGKIDYNIIWNRIIKRKPSSSGKKTFLGAFVDWDNSPRKKYNATIFINGSPQKFGYYLYEQIKKAKNINNTEFIFINAWNEWAEGAYLEPDKKNKYSYLEEIKNALLKSSSSGNLL